MTNKQPFTILYSLIFFNMNKLRINPYLTFNGNCREAMTFYKECIGAELMMQTIEQSPMAKDMPNMKDKIMHACLSKDKEVLLLASDFFMGESLVNGNTVSLTLNFINEEELSSVFKKLAEGGKVTMELSETFWAKRYGELVDKFGIKWLFNCSKEMSA